MKTIIKSSSQNHWLIPIVASFTCLLYLFSSSCDKIEMNQDALKSPSIKYNKPKEKQDIIDVDGNIYNTVKIGNQVWMAENLRVTKYNDGIEIPPIESNDAWSELTTPAYCWYNNEISNKDIYGALYNWSAVNTGKLCPVGWHVPTDSEWAILTDYLGGIEIAGGKLKETGTIHWLSPNGGATNETGFSALPGGCRYTTGVFDCLGSHSYWWSSTLYYTSDAAFWRAITWENGRLEPATAPLNLGFSIRCVKD